MAKTALITVGSTKFDGLISQAVEISQALSKQGYHSLVIQHGKSKLPEGLPGSVKETFEYSDSLSKYIDNADIIISHAGARIITSENWRVDCAGWDTASTAALSENLIDTIRSINLLEYTPTRFPEFAADRVRHFFDSEAGFPVVDAKQTALSNTNALEYTSKEKALESLLSAPVIFQEASNPASKGLGIPNGYKAVNEELKATPKEEQPYSPSKASPAASESASASNSATTSAAASPATKPSAKDLYPWPIAPAFPKGINNVGKGLRNVGNTCFLNSTMQCLLHTPSLMNFLQSQHAKGRPDKKFCMIEALKACAKSSFSGSGGSYAPAPVVRNLKAIAKHMTVGRQEDAQEFLRYAADALQASYLSNFPKSAKGKQAETNPIHKIFGGKLRSRVLCQNSKHASDTFDTFMDLSVNVKGCSNIQESFKSFTALDRLEGANKYKCESCKKPVPATKQFTVHEAPQCLTVHLKRFSPLGQKLNGSLAFDENLDIQKYMSKGQPSPKYKLYGVVSHYGGSARSGHYIAHVRAPNGRWYEMNDDMVSPSKPPFGSKNAYVLFYEKERSSTLKDAVQSATSATPSSEKILGKRKVNEDGSESPQKTPLKTPVRNKMQTKAQTPVSAPAHKPRLVSFDMPSSNKAKKRRMSMPFNKRDTPSDDLGSPVVRR
ncbi:hypothetical protein E3P94_00216 [Wallemia ichthyophaga]|nr:hypothetical protein E3P91_02310 [Wallemia ichthyophaga]TIB04305.1 hypothetical protein E3P95_00216 [Wallemia ichthyophaga]TIB05370.1 hypothetical protein E3P94_00216 [Wallemia ichthyophaga]TIB44012.1 hypothetical protein E3P83_00323 [Wallemia ichthyophaga]